MSSPQYCSTVWKDKELSLVCVIKVISPPLHRCVLVSILYSILLLTDFILSVPLLYLSLILSIYYFTLKVRVFSFLEYYLVVHMCVTLSSIPIMCICCENTHTYIYVFYPMYFEKSTIFSLNVPLFISGFFLEEGVISFNLNSSKEN